LAASTVAATRPGHVVNCGEPEWSVTFAKQPRGMRGLGWGVPEQSTESNATPVMAVGEQPYQYELVPSVKQRSNSNSTIPDGGMRGLIGQEFFSFRKTLTLMVSGDGW
jgi:hypothetical protein